MYVAVKIHWLIDYIIHITFHIKKKLWQGKNKIPSNNNNDINSMGDCAWMIQTEISFIDHLV